MRSPESPIAPNETGQEVTGDTTVTAGQFVELPEGGYVRASAWEAYQGWQQEAEVANKGRSFFKKVFFLGKLTAADVAQERSFPEHIERRNIDQEVALLKQTLHIAFEKIINVQGEQLSELLESHAITSVVSEDYSGRIPAEVLHRAINTIYERKKEDPIPLIPIISNRVTGKRFVEEQAQEIVESGRLGKGVMYVTEYIAFGGSIKRSTEALSQALQMKHALQGEKSTDFFAFVTIGQSTEKSFNQTIESVQNEHIQLAETDTQPLKQELSLLEQELESSPIANKTTYEIDQEIEKQKNGSVKKQLIEHRNLRERYWGLRTKIEGIEYVKENRGRLEQDLAHMQTSLPRRKHFFSGGLSDQAHGAFHGFSDPKNQTAVDNIYAPQDEKTHMREVKKIMRDRLVDESAKDFLVLYDKIGI